MLLDTLSLAFTHGKKSWIQCLAQPMEVHHNCRFPCVTQGCCCTAGVVALVVKENSPCSPNPSLQGFGKTEEKEFIWKLIVQTRLCPPLQDLLLSGM